MPVERFLVQHHHVRRQCIGFWSEMINVHKKVTVCDACRDLCHENYLLSLKNHRLRRLWSGVWSKISVCDACASDFGRK